MADTGAIEIAIIIIIIYFTTTKVNIKIYEEVASALWR